MAVVARRTPRGRTRLGRGRRGGRGGGGGGRGRGGGGCGGGGRGRHRGRGGGGGPSGPRRPWGGVLVGLWWGRWWSWCGSGFLPSRSPPPRSPASWPGR